jgi:hypothetical protein
MRAREQDEGAEPNDVAARARVAVTSAGAVMKKKPMRKRAEGTGGDRRRTPNRKPAVGATGDSFSDVDALGICNLAWKVEQAAGFRRFPAHHVGLVNGHETTISAHAPVGLHEWLVEHYDSARVPAIDQIATLLDAHSEQKKRGRLTTASVAAHLLQRMRAHGATVKSTLDEVRHRVERVLDRWPPGKPPPCPACGLPSPVLPGTTREPALVVLTSGLPVHNPALDGVPQNARWILLGRAADTLGMPWWDRLQMVLAEVMSRHQKFENTVVRMKLGEIAATPDELAQAEASLVQVRAVVRILRAAWLAAALEDQSELDELAQRAAVYLRKHEDVHVAAPEATTKPRRAHGGDVEDPSAHDARVKAAHWLASQAALSFDSTPTPHDLAADLARDIRNNATKLAPIATALHKNFDAPDRIEEARRRIRRDLDTLPRDPDPWERAQHIVRAFLRGVGYPIPKANRLFDAVEPIDRATLEAWIADFRRRVNS